MRKFYLISLILLAFTWGRYDYVYSQERVSEGEENTNPNQHFCGTHKATTDFYKNHPKAKTQKTSQIPAVREFINKGVTAAPPGGTYIIPVVFHVFGTDFQGHTVDDQVVQSALDLANTDFNGLNDDFNSVDAEFVDRRATLNIQFELAKIDPWGNICSGIDYHPNPVKGFGNGGGYDDEIKKYAWDNYKYLNIYIMVDLYNNGVTNNSGVCWYPDVYMSDEGLARMVFNGRYLGSNSYSPQFASSFSHELGHYLNLKHTFENGCDDINDGVDDTPVCDESAMGCDHPVNCRGNRINSENYMDYNTDCYSMFTQGQVSRMLDALDHPARVTLWQTSNLEATGLAGTMNPGLSISSRIMSEANGNDGSISAHPIITALNGATYAKTGVLTLNTDYTIENLPAGLTSNIEVIDATHAEISFTGQASNHLKDNSTDNINIVFNQSSLTNDLSTMLNSAIRNLVINFKDPYRLVFSETFNSGNDNDIIASNVSVWKPFTIDGKAYGAYYNSSYASNTGALMLETYTLPIVCQDATKNIQLISEGEDIGAASNFVDNDGYYMNLPVFSSDAYTDWNGNEGYFGFSFNNEDGEPCYGWMKASVSADGNTLTIMEYAYNEEPNATIKAGETGPIISFSDIGFHESLANNDGSIENTIEISLRDGSFTKTGVLTENTDYTFVFDQNGFGGISPIINVTSPTTAEFSFTGNANWNDYKTFGTLKFSEAALLGGASKYQGNTADLQLYFRSSYECISSTNFNSGWNEFFTPVEVTTENNWAPFHINNDASFYFGGFKTNQGDLKFETYNVPVVCNENTYQIIPLEFNARIDANSNYWVTHSGDATVHQIYTPDYTIWAGQTAYVGFSIPRENNYYKNYGWYKITVNNEGTEYSITEWGMNLTPNEHIFAGGLNRKEIKYSSSHFQETETNDGQLSGRPIISVFGGKFAKSKDEELLIGSDYSLSNVPNGLLPHILVTSENKAELYFTGNAVDHSQSAVTLTLTFLDPVFIGNDILADYEGYTFDFSMNMVDNYSIVTVPVNQTADALNSWQSFSVHPDDGNVSFGFYFTNNKFEFIAENTQVICEPNNIAAIADNTMISANNNFKSSSGYLDLYNDSYQDWKGVTRYVGFKYLAYNNYYVYGWIKCTLNEEAQSLNIIEYAYNEAPNQPIYTGQTELIVPVADFVADKQNILEGEQISFEDKSNNYPTSWEWSFVGGTPETSIEQNPKVTYALPGTYKVSLKVTNSAGNNTKEISSYITVNENVVAPVADFDADKLSIIEGEQISFEDKSTNHPTSWEWSFVGGTPETSIEQNPKVTYALPGTYKVSLKVTNSAGNNTKEISSYITVNEKITAPVAEFVAKKTIVQVDGEVGFTDNSTNKPTSWEWTFENGNPAQSNEQNPVIKFTKDGYNKVTLKVSNSAGSDTQEQESLLLVVSDKIADFTSSSTSIKKDETVIFTTSEFEYPVSYNWTFDGGTPESSTDKNPEIAYNNTGVFNVKLIAEASKNEEKIQFEQTATINVSSTTGFENLADYDLRVYPNPVSDIIKIASSNAHIDKVSIMNMSGKTLKIFTTLKHGKVTECNISDLDAGMYLVTIYLSDKQVTGKFFKK